MKTIIVVEGKSDTNRLKSIYKNIVTFETNGLGLDDLKINELKKLSYDNKIIVFTDPDGPGEIIRGRLKSSINGLYHAYLPNEKAISKNKQKIGIEHASKIDIENALSNLYKFEKIEVKFNIEDLIIWNIYNNKKKRIVFCDKLNIAFGNNKKVIEQLNYFNIDELKIKNVVEELNNASI